MVSAVEEEGSGGQSRQGQYEKGVVAIGAREGGVSSRAKEEKRRALFSVFYQGPLHWLN